MSATERQVEFLKTLFTEATDGTKALVEAGKTDEVTTVTKLVEPLTDTLVAVLQGSEVDKGAASSAITTLIFVNKRIKAATAPPTPVGLVRFHPKRVIANRFAKACQVCNVRVPEAEGFAVLTGGGTWLTVCKPCATVTDEERAAQAAAASEAARAEAAAQRAAAEAAYQAQVECRVLGLDLFVRGGVDGQQRPVVRVAVPSATGHNDLDFFTVSAARGYVSVARVIGGRPDQALCASQAVRVLERLACVEDIPAAMATFGRELGFCGRCGRHLTDEVSRSVGFGPDCAEQYGF